MNGWNWLRLVSIPVWAGVVGYAIYWVITRGDPHQR